MVSSSESSWSRSDRCTEDSTCVEVALHRGRVRIRGSLMPGLVLSFSPHTWAEFIGRIKRHELDLASA
ncbi:DUF397 domain-containing protein [Nonomuraea maheshkhaliensis]|uniref:DUF397 domain-containing protein n=1 Tax=Nonomuraea maheshkhaliensis TaxID=419590 RepID=UPI0031F8A935